MSQHAIVTHINENYSIVDIYELVYGHKPHSGKISCPFHHNVNTPAAKVYGNVIKCFGECNRVFGPYDMLKKFFPEEINKIKGSILIQDRPNERKKITTGITRNGIDITEHISIIIEKVLNGHN